MSFILKLKYKANLLTSTLLCVLTLTQFVPILVDYASADSVGGISQAQRNLFNQGITSFDIDGCSNDSLGDGSTTSGGSGSCCSTNPDSGSSGTVPGDVAGGVSVWKSGVSPPYIVEEYAINVLEDLAQKKGVPATNTVTSQHVLALVTWAVLEGGDINNTDLFNLWNTSQTGSDLGASLQTTGNMAYPSFDQGVEAASRTIDDGNHNYMLQALLNPNSTAKNFGYAESYSGTPSEPGTLEWAGAAHDNPSAYYSSKWLVAIQEVQSDYSKYAALIIGTPSFELIDNTENTSKLSSINSSLGSVGSGPTSTSSGCGSAVSANAQGIVDEALKLAWPEPFGKQKSGSEPGRISALTNTDAYTAALSQIWGSSTPPNDGADCGTFVSAVMRTSGADPNYPLSGTGSQWRYVVSHPDKYDVQYNVTSMSQLQPGDILIIGGPSGSGGAGHTWIYVGPQTGGYYSASASEGQRSANLTDDQLSDSSATGGYMLARLK